jgi:hypothetical protein
MLKVQVESLQIGVWIFADVLDSFASFAGGRERFIFSGAPQRR